MLLTRFLSGLILIPVVLLVLYLGGWPLLFLVLVASAIGAHEFYGMFQRGGQRPFVVLGVLATLALTADAYLSQMAPSGLVPTAIILVALGYAVLVPWPPPEAASGWMLTVAGALYVGWLFRYALLLRALPAGFEWSVTALAATWAADTGAYLAGRAFGRHKFCPRISPAKTWEGIAGGLVLTVVVTDLLGVFLLHLTVGQSLPLGVLITLAAVIGDLAESLLKRAATVKDSGSLIPGHGGLLDRADSILFVLPVVYYFQQLVVK